MGKKEYSEVIDSSVSKPFLKSKDQTLLQEKKKIYWKRISFFAGRQVNNT